MEAKRLACWIACVTVIPSAGAQMQAEYRPGAVVGAGYESLTDTLRGTCIEFETVQEDNPGAQEKTYNIKEVTDDSQLTQVLGLSGSASYKGLFGTAEGKAAFAKTVKVNQYSNTFAVRMSVRNSARSIVRPKLTSEMAALARKSLHDFRLKCGNMFVQSVRTGGELNGYIRVETSDLSTQQTISASFSLDSKKLDLEGSGNSDLTRALKQSRTEAKVFEAGGTTAVSLTIDELINKVRGFPAAVQTQAITYAIYVNDYRTAEGFPSEVDMTASDRVMDRILSKAWELNSILEDIRIVRARPDQFHRGRQSLAMLSGLDNQVSKVHLPVLEKAVDACREGKDCVEPSIPDPFEIRSQLPLRYLSRCEPISLRNLVSSKLGLFDDANDDEAIPPKFSGFTVRADRKVGSGDNDMSGNNPRIELDLRLVVPATADDMKLELQANLKIRESKPDHTTFTGASSVVIHQLLMPVVDAGAPPLDAAQDARLSYCRYDRAQPAQVMTGRLDVNGGKDEHKPRAYGNGSGILRAARCRSDTKGSDLGYLFCDSIRLHDTAIRLRHVEDVDPNIANARMKKEQQRRQAIRRELKL